jgi:ribosomal protein S18 acetylase RimI-like enzyme
VSDDITLDRLNGETAQPLIDELVAVYLDVYADAGPAFFNEDRYRRQLTGHMAAPRWEAVTATHGHQIIGHIYGFALPASTRWWNGLLTDVSEDFTTEDGHRTVAISEILITAGWRRRGIARRLHDAFLAGRPEPRTTLLVEPDNHPANAAYTDWGWQTAAQLRPSWDNAPLYNVLIRPTHLAG